MFYDYDDLDKSLCWIRARWLSTASAEDGGCRTRLEGVYQSGGLPITTFKYIKKERY